MTMTYQEAMDSFDRDIRPAVIAQYGENDAPALAEAWNDWTDMLAKERNGFNDTQYHFCPAVDDDIPDDDLAFILDAMGVGVHCTRVTARDDKLMDDMPKGSSHWKFKVTRDSHWYAGFYSMGPAHKDEPDPIDLLQSLFSDASGADDSFEDWCSNLGYDTDSRRAERTYNACRDTLTALQAMFNPQEFSDLAEMFNDR